MSPVQLIRYCCAAGIRLQAHGENLHVEAPSGLITPELKKELARNKSTLLATVIIQSRMLALAEKLGVPRRVLDRLPPEELVATAEQTALCEFTPDSNGDPLAQTLLVFYLQTLAGEKEMY